MLRNDLFRFIAFKLEGKHEPKGDIIGETAYGITKVYYPDEFERIKNAKPEEREDVILAVYNELYEKSKAKYLKYPLNYYYFDFWFHKAVAAVNGLQLTVNWIKQYRLLEVDGVFGPKTLLGVEQVINTLDKIDLVCNKFNNFRIEFYNKSHSHFSRGWINRVLRLSDFVLYRRLHNE